MNLLELAQECREIKFRIAGAALVGGLLTFGIGRYIVSYEATAYILVRPGGEISETNFGNSQVGMAYAPQIEHFSTQARTYIKLLKSRRVIKEAVERQDLARFYENPNPLVEGIKQPLRFLFYGKLPANEMTGEEMAILLTSKRTHVNIVTLSSVLEVKVRDRSAQRATDLANEITTVFIEYSQERSVASVRETRENLEQQLEQTQIELREWQDKLAQINKEQDTVFYSETELELERKRLLAELGLLQSRLEETRQDVGLNIDRLKAMEAKLGELPEQLKSLTSVAANPNLQALNVMLLNSKLDLQKVLLDFTPEDLRTKAVEANIEEIKKAIKEEAATILTQDTTQLDPVRQKLLGEYITLQIEIGTNPATEASLVERASKQREAIGEFETKAREIGLVTRMIGSLLATEFKLSGLADIAKTVEAASLREVEVIEPAMTPRYPTIKNAPLAAYVMLGAFASMIAAAAIGIFGRELLAQLPSKAKKKSPPPARSASSAKKRPTAKKMRAPDKEG